MNDSRLSKPLTIGNLNLHHRIGMAPLTRFRASDDHVPVDIMTEYYGQCSSVAGTLIISEGTLVSQADGGIDNVPGIWNKTQVDAWRKITDKVHANGCYIICQLWAFGRAASPEVMAREGFPVIGPDAIPMDSSAPTPQRLSTSGVREKIQDYVNAAKNAIAAGFDGVEIHGAGGFLIDQFTQDVSNQRNDEYGGSIENRSCFAVELTKAIADAIGSDKVGIRLSPFGTFQGMGMRGPIPQFSDLITKLGQLKLAYLHLVEARIRGTEEIETPETLDFAYDLWDRTFLISGGYKVDSAQRLVDVERPDKDIVVVFGRYFISTPDLPFRVLRGLEFTPYNRATFYHAKSAEGYIDYPFSPEFLQQSSQQQIVYRASPLCGAPDPSHHSNHHHHHPSHPYPPNGLEILRTAKQKLQSVALQQTPCISCRSAPFSATCYKTCNHDKRTTRYRRRFCSTMAQKNNGGGGGGGWKT